MSAVNNNTPDVNARSENIVYGLGDVLRGLIGHDRAVQKSVIVSIPDYLGSTRDSELQEHEQT
jgi:hypothetical protein